MRTDEPAAEPHSHPAFDRFCRDELLPLTHGLEESRQGSRAESGRRLGAAAISVVAAGTLIYFTAPLEVGAGGLVFETLLVLSAVVLFAWAWWPRLGHARLQTSQILPRVVSFLGDLEYEPQPNLDVNRYAAWAVLPRFKKRWAADVVKGSHRRVPLLAAEVKLLVLSSGGPSETASTQWVPVFEGLLVEARLPGRCRGTTVFGTRGMFEDHFERVDQATRPLALGGDAFEVFASDEVEARERLSPARLEGLEWIQATFGAERITGSFAKDRLVLLVEQPSGFLKIDDDHTDVVAAAERIRGQVSKLQAIVDWLELEPVLAPGETLAAKYVPEALPHESRARLQGWGCLAAFIGFALLVAALVRGLRTVVPAEALLGAAVGAAAGVILLVLAGVRALRGGQPRGRRRKRRRRRRK